MRPPLWHCLPAPLGLETLHLPWGPHLLLLKQAPAAGPQRAPPSAYWQFSVQQFESKTSGMASGSHCSPSLTMPSSQASAKVSPDSRGNFSTVLEREMVGPSGSRAAPSEAGLVRSTPWGMGVSEFEALSSATMGDRLSEGGGGGRGESLTPAGERDSLAAGPEADALGAGGEPVPVPEAGSEAEPLPVPELVTEPASEAEAEPVPEPLPLLEVEGGAVPVPDPLGGRVPLPEMVGAAEPANATAMKHERRTMTRSARDDIVQWVGCRKIGVA